METVIKQLMFEYYKRTTKEFELWLRDNYEYLLEKEKEQIIKAHIDGFDHIVAGFKKQEFAEQYYNETYNKIKS